MRATVPWLPSLAEDHPRSELESWVIRLVLHCGEQARSYGVTSASLPKDLDWAAHRIGAWRSGDDHETIAGALVVADELGLLQKELLS